MSYAVVYSSRTGNTALLARTIRDTLAAQECLYFGPPSPQALAAATLFVGFWTDRGSCDGEIAAFLRSLTTQRVFLFGTAGFGGEEAYFGQILARVEQNLGPSVRLAGSFLCQGRMPQAVRDRYAAMQDPRRDALLENFDRAASHPDARDLERLARAVGSCQPV